MFMYDNLSLKSSQSEKCQAKHVEKMKTHFLYSIKFYLKKS